MAYQPLILLLKNSCVTTGKIIEQLGFVLVRIGYYGKIIEQLGFERAYYGITVKHVIHNFHAIDTWILLQICNAYLYQI